jgi:hypothetical protein
MVYLYHIYITRQAECVACARTALRSLGFTNIPACAHGSGRITGLTFNTQLPKRCVATRPVTARSKPTNRRLRTVTRRSVTNLGRAFKPMTPKKTARPLACERHRVPRNRLFIVRMPIES